MKQSIKLGFAGCLLLVFLPGAVTAQSVYSPLNSSVSGFGTSFIFAPTPVCKGCLQTELGLAGVGANRFISAVLTRSPSQYLDVSVLFNPYERTSGDGHLGQRVDVVVRRLVFSEEYLSLTLAPRGATTFDGGIAIGSTVAGQYAKNGNILIVNLTGIRGLGKAYLLPQKDFSLSTDYARNLGSKGASVFGGFQLRSATGVALTKGFEVGAVFPFQNGQIESAVERYISASGSSWQVQARVLVNWQKIF